MNRTRFSPSAATLMPNPAGKLRENDLPLASTIRFGASFSPDGFVAEPACECRLWLAAPRPTIIDGISSKVSTVIIFLCMGDRVRKSILKSWLISDSLCALDFGVSHSHGGLRPVVLTRLDEPFDMLDASAS
jgi:hypothetical protein